MGLLSTLGGLAGGFFGGPVGSAVGGAIGGYFDSTNARDAADESAAAAAEANRQFQQYNSDTSMQRRVKDLQKAGLNPMLAYSQGGASTPSGGTAATTPAEPMINSGFTQVRVANETALAKSQIANQTSDTALKAAQTRNVETDSQLKAAQIPLFSSTAQLQESERQKIAQEITESNQRIDNLVRQGKLTDAEASKVRAEIPGVIAQRALIKAQIGEAKASALSHLRSGTAIESEGVIKQLEIPRAINRSEAESSWWKRSVSPYMDEILGVGGLGASAAGGFAGARAGRK